MVKCVLLIVNSKARKKFILCSTKDLCRGHKQKLLITVYYCGVFKKAQGFLLSVLDKSTS